MIARLRAGLEIFGRFMGRVWLTILYFTVVFPFGIIARLRAGRERAGESAWNVRNQAASDVQEARRQF